MSVASHEAASPAFGPAATRTPIFVLGKQRSGTTWLATALARHPDVAAVLRPGYDSVLESHFFTGLYRRYGDLSTFPDFAEFASVFAAGEYYRLMNLPASVLFEAWPTTYAGAFRASMDAFAAREGRSHWLEKSPGHTLLVAKLAAWYPDARFVAVSRDPEEVVASTLRLVDKTERASTRGIRRSLKAARSALGWALHDAAVRDAGHRGVVVEVVEYQQLRENPRTVLEHICTSVELPFDEAVLDAGFAPNTSFASAEERARALAPHERRLVRAVKAGARYAPFRMLDGARRALDAVRGRRSLPSWYFASLRDRYAPNDRT